MVVVGTTPAQEVITSSTAGPIRERDMYIYIYISRGMGVRWRCDSNDSSCTYNIYIYIYIMASLTYALHRGDMFCS